MRKVIGLFQLFLLIDSLIGSCSFGRRVGLLSKSFVIHYRLLLGLIFILIFVSSAHTNKVAAGGSVVKQIVNKAI